MFPNLKELELLSWDFSIPEFIFDKKIFATWMSE
jgi:hypothetical protein